MAWKRKSRKTSKIQGAEDLYRDVMLDIETLGTNKKSQVLSIGAVRFRMDTMDDASSLSHEDRTFYARLDLDSQKKKGRTTDPDTIEWWDKQSKEARAVFEEDEERTADVLRKFREFCKGAKRIWGNGATFDNVIIRDLYEDYKQEYPVPFWGDLDFRTLKYLWNKLTDFMFKGQTYRTSFGTKHNALDDAKEQVVQAQRMYRDIRGTKYGA